MAKKATKSNKRHGKKKSTGKKTHHHHKKKPKKISKLFPPVHMRKVKPARKVSPSEAEWISIANQLDRKAKLAREHAKTAKKQQGDLDAGYAKRKDNAKKAYETAKANRTKRIEAYKKKQKENAAAAAKAREDARKERQAARKDLVGKRQQLSKLMTDIRAKERVANAKPPKGKKRAVKKA